MENRWISNYIMHTLFVYFISDVNLIYIHVDDDFSRNMYPPSDINEDDLDDDGSDR